MSRKLAVDVLHKINGNVFHARGPGVIAYLPLNSLRSLRSVDNRLFHMGCGNLLAPITQGYSKVIRGRDFRDGLKVFTTVTIELEMTFRFSI